MEMARFGSEVKANTRKFGVLISMVFQCAALVCEEVLACTSRKE